MGAEPQRTPEAPAFSSSFAAVEERDGDGE
jgi:hypothetical protein